jgi:hypothetical protein
LAKTSIFCCFANVGGGECEQFWFGVGQASPGRTAVLRRLFLRKRPTSAPEPNLRSEILVQLHEGTKVSVEDQVEQWVKVRLANGTVGWLTQNDLRRIAF